MGKSAIKNTKIYELILIRVWDQGGAVARKRDKQEVNEEVDDLQKSVNRPRLHSLLGCCFFVFF